MKIWTSEHTFDHPWETVVQAAWRKYPNPLNKSVDGIDVVERHVDKQGVMHSQRLMQTRWPMPGWVAKIIGMHERAFVKETSSIDGSKKQMELKSSNLTLTSFLDVDERLIYSPHPDNPNHTLLRQETVIAVQGVPLVDYLEGKIQNTCNANAAKGRQAMEWVIEKIKEETSELSRAARMRIDRAAVQVDHGLDLVEENVAKTLPGSASSRP